MKKLTKTEKANLNGVKVDQWGTLNPTQLLKIKKILNKFNTPDTSSRYGYLYEDHLYTQG